MVRTPRQEAEDISSGIDKPHFIGPKSKEAYIQEIWSLYNTKSAFRSADWQSRVNNLKRGLQKTHGVTYTEQEWANIFKRRR